MVNAEVFSGIEEQTMKFDPITLGEMEHVKLMDRTDVKFMIPVNRLQKILDLAQQHYRILVIDEKRIFRYETLYYDTATMGLYHKHHAGHVNRYKVRYRNYVDSGTSFFEVKLKNNKGRTLKTRVGQEEGRCHENLDEASSSLLLNKTTLNPAHLSPVLWVNYSRLTLVSISSGERITLDLNLTFKNGEKEKKFPALVIAEVKQDKAGADSVFLEIMRNQRIIRGGISKYCFAVISLFDNIKSNRFKSKVKFIHKIQKQNALYAPVRHAQFA
jgi:hypothetical protein